MNDVEKGRKIGELLAQIAQLRAKDLARGLLGRECDVESADFVGGVGTGFTVTVVLLSNLGVIDDDRLIGLDLDELTEQLS